MPPLSTLDRRTVLKALSLAPLAVLPSGLAARAETAGLITTDVCLLQKEVTEGPFYIDPHLLRSDITEGKPGLPLQLRLQVVTADCAPVVGARVDVWHCDATGVYSGVQNMGAGGDTTGQNFLRGTQMTDVAGVASFQTVFPGWYRGRTTHIHYKVFLDQRSVLTSQIFFDEAVIAEIYAEHSAYARRDKRDVMNVDDGIAADAGAGAYARVRMTAPDGVAEAALVVGVSPEAGASGLLDWLLNKA
ncbi:intradiol ring-cleavage dioxygenase [Cypionkella sinensis]|uniref:Intradiol ring-cleavage dioxygenase n=1 Tax=Cypionkella sinensis TaxID=1756043 RepID=A0ABV7IZ87_9RHOB